MKHHSENVSAGLAFLRATALAIPKTLGDRERIAAMSEAMSLAVRNRFVFDRNDSVELKRLNIQTCVGVFRPAEDWYELACQAGGTYARMWETHHEQKAWVAAQAVFARTPSGGQYNSTPEFIANNRVAPGVALLMPPAFSAADPKDVALASYEGRSVWWCTSMDNETITLCRYAFVAVSEPWEQRQRGLKRAGSPARVRKLTRNDWARWNEQVKAEMALAA